MRIDEPECVAPTYDIRYYYDIPLYTGGGSVNEEIVVVSSYRERQDMMRSLYLTGTSSTFARRHTSLGSCQSTLTSSLLSPLPRLITETGHHGYT